MKRYNILVTRGNEAYLLGSNKGGKAYEYTEEAALKLLKEFDRLKKLSPIILENGYYEMKEIT